MYEFPNNSWYIVEYWFDEIEENFYSIWKKERVVYVRNYGNNFRKYTMDKIIKMPKCIRRKLEKMAKDTDAQFAKMQVCRNKLCEKDPPNGKWFYIAEKIKELTYKI